jgi:hypothetical protein
MIGKVTAITTILIVLILTGNSWAHHAAGATVGEEAGPITTISAATLDKGMITLSLFAEYIKLDPFSDAELKALARNGQDVHSHDSIFHGFAGIGYGITNDLTVALRIPYESIQNIRASEPDDPDIVTRHGDSKGIGDLSILGIYRFAKLADLNLSSALLLGIKVPTGRTSVKGAGGVRLETEQQPGSGSWDPMIGIAATKRFGRLSLDANLLYMFATRGSQDTNLGDLFNYNLAASYRLSPKPFAWDLVLEMNGEWKDRQKIAGVRDPNSGGSEVYLSPGVRLSFGKGWAAFLSVGLPIVQNVNGEQDKVTYRTFLGVAVAFQ